MSKSEELSRRVHCVAFGQELFRTQLLLQIPFGRSHLPVRHIHRDLTVGQSELVPGIGERGSQLDLLFILLLPFARYAQEYRPEPA